VIEHNLDVIKTSDWVVDMGPEGGSGGGIVVAEGTPEQVAAVEASYTGQFLRAIVSAEQAPAQATAARPTPARRSPRAAVAAG
ncbi:MAG: hypothetical protein M3291_01385, partial [Actinomycetota bacterium]|nr:hypothetical protein [Actinomycetota bacterium]